MDSKPIRNGIISSIIAAVLTAIFINPILSFVWKILIGAASKVHRGYVDRVYSYAAGFASGSLPAYFTFFALIFIILMVSVFFFLQAFAVLAKEILSKDSPVRRAAVYSCAAGAALGVVLAFIGPLSLFVGIARISTSFDQRLTVLAPAITDTEYKTWKARWVTMHSQADYEAIVSAMDKRAAELGVTLPPVRKP